MTESLKRGLRGSDESQTKKQIEEAELFVRDLESQARVIEAKIRLAEAQRKWKEVKPVPAK